MAKRRLTGKVVSAKMQKTVVVEVERIKEHLKYRRRFKVHKKYKAHVETGDFKAGDVVIIEECRPISKDKKWKVVEKLARKEKETPEEIPAVLEEKVENIEDKK